ncbi:MAG: glycosyltransferase [Planctomycetes bacterium]|nr:glycosyltransferase [Planctomycetota bacterium]
MSIAEAARIADQRTATDSLRVLALAPPDPGAGESAAYTFLQEEFAALARAGLEIHTISPYVGSQRRLGAAVVHPVPRSRRCIHTLRAFGWWAKPFRDTGLCGGPVERLFYSRLFATAAAVVKQARIDLIYAPFAWPGGTAGAAVRRECGAPLVVSLRGCDALVEPSISFGETLDPGYRRRLAFALKTADQVVGVSRALVERALQLGCPPEKVSVCLKGVDHKRFVPGDRQAARAELGLPNRPTALFVGGLEPYKGVAAFPPAWKIVCDRIPDAQLVLCGDGRQCPLLQQEVRDRGLDGRVRFLGRIPRDKMPRYFHAADVFVFPSLAEGSGNALLEAAASGLPLVGADAAGIPDYLEDGATGLLFRKGDAADMAAKVVSIVQNPTWAGQLGRAARRRVELQFRYEQMIDRLTAVFQRALSRKR